MTTRLVLAALGGVLLDGAFAPYDQWPAALLGIAAILYVRRGLGPARSWLVGFAGFLPFYLLHLHFTSVAAGTPIAWIALAVSQAAITALVPWGLAVARLAPGLQRGSTRWAVGRAFVAACLWVTVEQLRAVWPFSGLPWGNLAFSQTTGPFLALAPFGGTVLVSGAVVLTAALAAEAAGAFLQCVRSWPHFASVRRRPGELRAPLSTASLLSVLTVVSIALPGLVGLRLPAQVGDLDVLVAQGDVPTAGASWQDNAIGVLENHARVTREVLSRTDEQIDVVLWPESATDLDPRTYPDVAAVVDRVARQADAPILLGTQDFRPSLADPEYRTNDYVTWVPGEGAAASYSKQQPVAFGEYVPWRDFFRTFTSAVDLVGTDMVAGTEPGLVQVPGAGTHGADVPVAVGICFEVAYDRIIREGVTLGGQVIVIPTNNASFGMSRQADQQMAMSRFRAVEHARSVVQISTVGRSAIFAPDGQVLWDSGMWVPAGHHMAIPRSTSVTPANRLGDLPLVLAAGIGVSSTAAGLVASLLGRRRGRRAAAATVT